MGYEAENHCVGTVLLQGGQISKGGGGGGRALTAEKDKMDSSALEANVGRMPRYDTGPTVSRRFQLVHTQESILGQGTPSFWYWNALPFTPRWLLQRSRGRMEEFEFLSIYFKKDRWNLETGLNLFLAFPLFDGVQDGSETCEENQ